MKVQRKVEDKMHYRVQYEVVDQVAKYYICKGECGFLVALDKDDYDPVPEWVDISKDCKYELVDSVNQLYALCHGNNIVESSYQAHNYRVTKVGDGYTKVEVKR